MKGVAVLVTPLASNDFDHGGGVEGGVLGVGDVAELVAVARCAQLQPAQPPFCPVD